METTKPKNLNGLHHIDHFVEAKKRDKIRVYFTSLIKILTSSLHAWMHL